MYKYVLLLLTAFLGLNNLSVAQIREEPIMLRTRNCDIQGTLTLPEGNVKTIVLIVGGLGYIDGGVLGINSYRMYALELAERGVASVRYDMRGYGASRIQNLKLNEIKFSMYVEDVKSWVDQLYKRFPRVVIAGHSEGSLMGMVAIQEGAEADGFISISGMGHKIETVLREQYSSMPNQFSSIASDILDSIKMGRIAEQVPIYFRSKFSKFSQSFIISIQSYDPVAYMRRMRIPVMIIHGDTDTQVSVGNARALALANRKARLVLINGMNHIMKECYSTERSVQDESYRNPAYPLSAKFVTESIKFIEAI